MFWLRLPVLILGSRWRPDGERRLGLTGVSARRGRSILICSRATGNYPPLGGGRRVPVVPRRWGEREMKTAAFVTGWRFLSRLRVGAPDTDITPLFGRGQKTRHRDSSMFAGGFPPRCTIVPRNVQSRRLLLCVCVCRCHLEKTPGV